MFNTVNVFAEPMFNRAILPHYNFEESVSDTLGTRKMKSVCSFAGLNTENLKTIFVEPAQNTLQTWCLKTQLQLFLLLLLKKRS